MLGSAKPDRCISCRKYFTIEVHRSLLASEYDFISSGSPFAVCGEGGLGPLRRIWAHVGSSIFSQSAIYRSLEMLLWLDPQQSHVVLLSARKLAGAKHVADTSGEEGVLQWS